MSSKNAFLSELEDALANGPADRRAKTLRRVTDLFVFGSSHFSGDHVALFDGVFNHLISDIESSARAALADRLKSVPNAPPGVIRTLAFDDAIDVAGPILANSMQIDNAALVENARTKSQDHLLAISQRSSLVETVTDVLVERGNRDVALSTARNSGAKFSETGYIRLVQRSEQDDELAKSVGARPEIPRQYFLKLLTTASMTVRLALQSAHPEHAGDVQSLVGDIAAGSRLRRRPRRATTPLRRPWFRACGTQVSSTKAMLRVSLEPANSRKPLPRLRSWARCQSIWSNVRWSRTVRKQFCWSSRRSAYPGRPRDRYSTCAPAKADWLPTRWRNAARFITT